VSIESALYARVIARYKCQSTTPGAKSAMARVKRILESLFQCSSAVKIVKEQGGLHHLLCIGDKRKKGEK